MFFSSFELLFSLNRRTNGRTEAANMAKKCGGTKIWQKLWRLRETFMVQNEPVTPVLRKIYCMLSVLTTIMMR